MNPTRLVDPVETQEALSICAFNYIIIQIMQSIFDVEVCLWALIILIVGMYFVKRKGTVSKIMKKISERASNPINAKTKRL